MANIINTTAVKLDTNANPLTYGTSGAAGLDLSSCEKTTIYPGEVGMIKTGWSIKIPDGFVGLVCSRSGLAKNVKVCIANPVGIIDEDYLGPLNVLLTNNGVDPFNVKIGDRIGQLVVVEAFQLNLIEVQDHNVTTERGEEGFGSTGV
jgi:dUTP pyrophosphatase